MLTSEQYAKAEALYRLVVSDILRFAKLALNWQPHEGQRRWLVAPERSEQLLLTGRRWGKSEAEGVKTLLYALRHPGSLQAVVSITLDQAELIWGEVVSKALSSPLVAPLVAGRPTMTPFPVISFANGSIVTARSVARNGIYLRGHKYHRVVVDEADYVPERVIDDVVRMTLADYNGPLVMTTTPKPKRGLVFKTYKRGLDNDPSVYVQSGASFENPHISHAFIEAQQRRMTRGAWVREVLGQYGGDDDAVFGWGFIEAAYSAGPEKMTPYEAGHKYVAGIDVAKTNDYTVTTVLDITKRPWRLVYFDRFNKLPYPAMVARCVKVCEAYGLRSHEIAFDGTGVGVAFGDVFNEGKTRGESFVFTNKSKIELLTDLQLAFEQGELVMPFIKQLVDELQGYEWADDGLDTDCVMSLGLAIHAAKYGRSKRLVAM